MVLSADTSAQVSCFQNPTTGTELNGEAQRSSLFIISRIGLVTILMQTQVPNFSSHDPPSALVRLHASTYQVKDFK
jgi:hypothetical protein